MAGVGPAGLAVAALPLAVPAAAVGLTLLARTPRAVLGIARASAWALWALGAAVAVWPPAAWDPFARWYCLLALTIGGLAMAASVHGFGDGDQGARRHFALLHGFVLSLLATGSLPSYVAMWAGVEASTLTSVLLVAFPGGRHPVEAAWKYLLVTGVGGLLALLGTMLALDAAGLGAGARPAMEAGLVLALVGYGSKAGLAPWHTWLPDAHGEAPAPVSALLSGVKLTAGLYVLLRLAALAAGAIGPAWPHALLIGAGIVSLAVAAAAIPGQRDLKRLYAYSSIEHVGVIALGAGFGGVGVLGALLHMWTHGLGKSALFLGAGNVRRRYGEGKRDEVRGVLASLPLTGAALAVGTVAIAGLPPFGLFWSEWLVLWGGVRAGHPLWVAVALALLVASVLGFGLRVPEILLGPGPAGRAPAREPAAALWPLGLALAGVLVAGLALPAALHTTWYAAAGLLGGGAP